MELLKTKCLRCLYYALEACPVNKSVEFVVNGVITKIFSTKSNDVVNDCLLYFYCVVSDTIYRRKITFSNKFKHSKNS